MKQSKQPNTLNIDLLKEYLSYDADAGIVTWIKPPSRLIKIGSRAGCGNGFGYRQLTLRGVSLTEHRVVWALSYGSFPDGQIDHINGIRDDNRLCNLRCVAGYQNAGNKLRKRRDLPIGVHKQLNRYRTAIRFNGKNKYLGMFKTQEEAAAAYAVARREIYGDVALTYDDGRPEYKSTRQAKS